MNTFELWLLQERFAVEHFFRYFLSIDFYIVNNHLIGLTIIYENICILPITVRSES